MADAPPGGAALDWSGPSAPPRRNGELVFETLWESRLFGATMALHEAGLFAWDEFRDRLIAEIGSFERAHGARDEGFRYYACWLAAFERLVAEKGLCSAEDLEARVALLRSRPPGHDHERSIS
jgi:nitrile hydratase accessory protein